MKKLFLLFFIVLPQLVFGDTNSNQSQLLIGDNNGTNAGRYRSLKFTNGTTINNGDGSISVTTGGSGGGGSGAGFSGSASQGTIGFLDVQGTVTFIGGNSGLYYSGAGSTVGNVGIGSLAPGQKLDVQGTIRTTGFILSTTPTSGYVLTSDVNGKGTWQPSTGGSSLWNTINTNDVYEANGATLGNVGIGTTATTGGSLIVMGGNVGIGTITPTAQMLQVGGTASSHFGVNSAGNVGIGAFTASLINSTYSLDINNNMLFTPSGNLLYFGGIQQQAGGTQNIFKAEIRQDGADIKLDGGTLNENLFFGSDGLTLVRSSTDTNGSLQFLTNNLVREHIDLLGNVGIGSITPGQLLDVQGTIRATNFTNNSFATSSSVCTDGSKNLTTSGCTSGGSGTVTSVTLATPNSTLTVGGTNPVTTSGVINADINLTNANTWTGQQIFNSFNVGINSLTPGQALDVQGTVRATNFVGAGTGLTGTAAGLTAGTVTTNANLTGPITSSGNATSIASQTGTGTTFVTQAGSPNFTGNVGVNSANPGQRVDVQGTVRATAFVGDGSALTGIPLASAVVGTLAVNNGGSQWTGTGIGPLTYSLGNVGIGSVNPNQILDVQGTIRSTNFISNGGNYTQTGTGINQLSGNTGIGVAPVLKFQIKDGSSNDFAVGAGIMFGSGISISSINDNATLNEPLELRGTTFALNSSQWDLRSNGISRIFADASGNVSIGTTAATRTTVFGNIGIGATSSSLYLNTPPGLGGLIVEGNVAVGTITPSSKLTVMGGINVGANNADTYITTAAPSGGAIFLGNVGVGSNVPGAKLDVEGTIPTVFYSSGISNVGIGSINPRGMLDVEGTVNPTIFYATGSSNQNVGIGSPTPGFKLDVVGGIRTLGNTNNTTLNTTGGNVGIGTTVPNQNFTIKGSTASQWGSPIPVITSCGTSPSVKGTDHDFQITVGSITATGCTATFGGTYQDATCNISNQSMSITSALGYTVSSSAIVISQATGLVGDLLNVHCDFKN